MARRRQHGEGSLYQRSSDGRWIATVDLGLDEHGKRDRRVFTGTTPETAMRRRAEFLGRRRDGFVMPKGRQPYVSEWMLHWLHNIVAPPRVSPSTWDRSYRQKVTDLICPYFARVPLDKLDDADIQRWHRELAQRKSARTGLPLAPATRIQAHRLLSMGLTEAERMHRIGRNPARIVHAPPADPPEVLPPDEDEILAILRTCEGWRTGARWKTSIGTGLRQSEGLGLLWPLLDLADPQDAWADIQWGLARRPWKHGCGDPHACGAALHRYPCPPRCPKVRASGRPHTCERDPARCCPPGCGKHAKACPLRHGGGLVLQRPKSKASRARIPLPPYVATSLVAHRAAQRAERVAHPAWRGWAHDPAVCRQRLRPRDLVCTLCMRPARPGLLVFAAPDGMPVDPRADWQDWSDLLVAAGLPHYGVHGGRHATATWLLEAGTDIRVVQELMRHSSPDFTRRAYQHVRVKLKREAADTMDRLMRGGR